MKYKYNKTNLSKTFLNLSSWAENLDSKLNKQAIKDTWDGLEELMEYIQSDNDDIFGTEGYEATMMGEC